MEEENYEMAMPFIDQSESYSRGFAGGRLWEILKLRDFKQLEHPYIFLSSDLRQIEMILRRYHCSYEIEKLNESYSGIANIRFDSAN